MTEQSPGSEAEQRRRSAADLFLKVHDLDDAAGAESARRPIVRLCNLMIQESLQAGDDQLRVLAPTPKARPSSCSVPTRGLTSCGCRRPYTFRSSIGSR